MNRPAAALPGYSLAELLENLSALPNQGGRIERPGEDLNARIVDAIFRQDLLSWGRKDGGTERELIPELAWQMGKLDHRSGKLVYRHPDGPLPEEYTDIRFNRAEIDRWLHQRRLGGDDDM